MLKSIKSKRGELSIAGIVAVVIGLIMIIALAVPVAAELVESANLTGTTGTVAGLLPLLLICRPVLSWSGWA
jgi:hypothetical protein